MKFGEDRYSSHQTVGCMFRWWSVNDSLCLLQCKETWYTISVLWIVDVQFTRGFQSYVPLCIILDIPYRESLCLKLLSQYKVSCKSICINITKPFAFITGSVYMFWSKTYLWKWFCKSEINLIYIIIEIMKRYALFTWWPKYVNYRGGFYATNSTKWLLSMLMS